MDGEIQPDIQIHAIVNYESTEGEHSDQRARAALVQWG